MLTFDTMYVSRREGRTCIRIFHGQTKEVGGVEKGEEREEYSYF